MNSTLQSDIFSPGQILNNTYEITRVLGRGGTGEVYLARNQVVERYVAIKALNAQFSGKSDYLELMKREEQMRSIVHDAVVRYSECSRSDAGHVFLVMDYIEGPSLNEVMLERRLDNQDLMIIAHRVLEGLVATHAQGIVHRDLSPDNIILRNGLPEKTTIIDFGIAKDTAAGARTIVGNDFAGKYEYAAPEQLDGRADHRADFYALGASLLAAAKREIPQVGSSPGEVVRFKRNPLDSSGISPPLRDLINWLTDPDPARRPQSATEALGQLGEWLKPERRQDRSGRTRRMAKKHSFLWPAVLAAVLAVLGTGLWFAGVFAPSLPEAAPYQLTAQLDPEAGALLSGNAPDAETAASLREAFQEVSGTEPSENALTLARGMPYEDWPKDVSELLALASSLSRWELLVADRKATFTGLAPDIVTRDALKDVLEDWQSQAAMMVQLDLIAGPETLRWAVLQPHLDQLANCGPLSAPADQSTNFALFDTITVIGNVARPEDNQAIRTALAPVIGDRTLRVETTTLNKELCTIRAVLPPIATGTMSIWLGHGETGEAALDGVFHKGENPIADVLFPASITNASLWVMVVDNTGEIYHILPNINQPGSIVDDLGEVESGVRRVRVLWSLDQLQEDPRRPATKVSEGDYGKSEIVAILSRIPLFDSRRPREESVSSVADALAETLGTRKDQIIGVTTRIIDARP